MEMRANTRKMIAKSATIYKFSCTDALICEHPCEARCRRNMLDTSVNIRGLKKMAVDSVSASKVPVPDKAEKTGKKVAIIGGGPSGLSAAYYLELMGHDVTVFNRGTRPLGLTGLTEISGDRTNEEESGCSDHRRRSFGACCSYRAGHGGPSVLRARDRKDA